MSVFSELYVGSNVLTLRMYNVKFWLNSLSFLRYSPRITNTALHIFMTGDQTKYPSTFSRHSDFSFEYFYKQTEEGRKDLDLSWPG